MVFLMHKIFNFIQKKLNNKLFEECIKNWTYCSTYRLKQTIALTFTTFCEVTNSFHTMENFTKIFDKIPESGTVHIGFHGTPFGQCRDGRLAKIVLTKHIRTGKPCLDIQYWPIDARKSVPIPSDAIKGKIVFMLDVTCSSEDTQKMIDDSAEFFVVDHHGTNVKKLASIPDANKHFDMKNSASWMVWKLCNPGTETVVPLLVKCVDEHDCYRENISEDSKAAKLLLDASEKELKDDDKIDAMYLSYLEDDALFQCDISEKGIPLLKEYHDAVNEIAGNAEVFKCTIDGTSYLGCRFETPSFNKMSDAGAKCFEMYPNIHFMYMYKEGTDRSDSTKKLMNWAFRSTDERLDVGALAKTLGGGGHRNSSGASTANHVSKDLPNMTDVEIVPKESTSWFQSVKNLLSK